MTFTEFKIKYSELICFYQCIEADLRWIYAILSNNNSDHSIKYKATSKYTLGQTIKALEKLENKSEEKLFIEGWFASLRKAAHNRNFWCHKCFVCFMYNKNFELTEQFTEACKMLENDHLIIGKFQKKVEDIKLLLVERSSLDKNN